MFANVEEAKQKAETLNGIKTEEFRNLSNGKYFSIGVLHQMESTWKVTEV